MGREGLSLPSGRTRDTSDDRMPVLSSASASSCQPSSCFARSLRVNAVQRRAVSPASCRSTPVHAPACAGVRRQCAERVRRQIECADTAHQRPNACAEGAEVPRGTPAFVFWILAAWHPFGPLLRRLALSLSAPSAGPFPGCFRPLRAPPSGPGSLSAPSAAGLAPGRRRWHSARVVPSWRPPGCVVAAQATRPAVVAATAKAVPLGARTSRARAGPLRVQVVVGRRPACPPRTDRHASSTLTRTPN